MDDSFELLLVGPSGRGGIDQYIAGQVERLDCNITVHDTQSPSSGSGLVWFLRATLAGLAAMVAFTRRSRPDLVHVHTSHYFAFYRAAFYVLYSKLVWRVPVVLHVHGSSFDEFVVDAPPLVAGLQRLVFGACDRIIVLSTYWRDILVRRCAEDKFATVPNAVDPTTFPTRSDDGPHIVFISNLIERKGVRELVEAVDSLCTSTDTPFTVTIAGDGPLADDVETLADRHDEVSYLGYVTEERKRTLLGDASIYVLPTHAEGLPIALLEGMAGGNAVVSTDVAAIPEVIDEERGILVEPGDVGALESALAELVTNSDRRRSMGRNNRKAIEEQYSWDAVIEKLRELYQSLVPERGADSGKRGSDPSEVDHARQLSED